ncbi:MAG: hypothetical protein K2Q25_02245 [Mycobacteriaceae bacterium]|nr:hypothetical protein [Mycobacteriaceae bacterium]
MNNLNDLRRQLLARLDAHPVKQWSPMLLRAIITIIDLDITEPGFSALKSRVNVSRLAAD